MITRTPSNEKQRVKRIIGRGLRPPKRRR